jgi:hypothetical protein
MKVSVMKKEERNYGRLNDELRRATDKARLGYLTPNVTRLRNCKEQDGMI